MNMENFFYRQLAKAAQCAVVLPGQAISLKVDLALAHDGSGPEVLERLKRGLPMNSCPRLLMTLDHAFPAPTIQDREFHREMADFARQNGIILYKNGEGVLHQVVAEEESLWPGMIIVGADGHVATAGAFGSIAFSVSSAVFSETVAAGYYRTTAPEQVVIALEGNHRPHVMARDIAMFLIREYRALIEGKAVLLTGSSVAAMNISEKMSLCNFLPESGIVTVLVLPQGEEERPDLKVNVQEIGPMLAVPGTTLSIDQPGSYATEKISAAIAGGCSSGRLDDMRVIADVLTKDEVHEDVTFIITPGSKNVMASMDKLEISTILRNRGAVIMPPGCGPCPGRHFGVLSAADVAVTTTIRSSPGRIGAHGARIYLASPLTVALSAVSGVITEPPETVYEQADSNHHFPGIRNKSTRRNRL